MIALAELQRQFQQFVLGGDFAVMRTIEDGPHGKPGPRLAIYHEAYRIRLRDSLADTFGTLLRHLGDAAFTQASARYIEASTSSSRNIRWYGGGFADFLRETKPFDEQPWLAELARFDWALVCAFDAADAVPVGFGDLTRLSVVAWTQMAFAFHPSVQRLSLVTNAPTLRRAADRDEPLPEAYALDTPVEWLVWRRDDDTHFRSMHEVEALVFDAAVAGAPFPRICERVGERLGADAAPAQAAVWLRHWIDEGLIARLII